MKKVLVIDDATFMRLAIRRILERNGFVVVGEAENGHKGYEKYMELKPDIVSMDITMPEMNGIECLKKIKDSDSKASVIMITAMGQESMLREAIMSGAKGFIVKPFKEETVLSAFNKI
jgi:two-component system chemotaxis response regulator CheY